MNDRDARTPALDWTGYVGLAVTALVTLMFEILLTRIFSVTMFYHFAFVAVSIAMFGLSVGAIAVYLMPRLFAPERARLNLALNALLFSATIVGGFAVHLAVQPWMIPAATARDMAAKLITYVATSVPFFFSGVVICICLTQFPRQVSRLYAADLAGAGAGCLLLIGVINLIGNGPVTVIALAGLASVGALIFAVGARRRYILVGSLALAVFFFAVAGALTLRVYRERPLPGLFRIAAADNVEYVFERWNHYARVTIQGDGSTPTGPVGWGFSPALPDDIKIRQHILQIDAAAGTTLTKFDGDLSDVEFLKYDITNLVHYLRGDADVAVIGSGGGRDILSALVFDQNSVTAIEINKLIVSAVNERFGEFTGRLDELPNVQIVTDEARS